MPFMPFNDYLSYVRFMLKSRDLCTSCCRLLSLMAARGAKKDWIGQEAKKLETLRTTPLGKVGLFLINLDNGYVPRSAVYEDYVMAAVLEQVREVASYVPVAFWSSALAEGNGASILVCNRLSCARNTKACKVGTRNTLAARQIRQPGACGGTRS